MKKLLTIVLCAAVALFAGCTKPREVDGDLLQDRNGIAYLPNEEKPFTGVAVEKYDNGQKESEFTYKDGKEHGLSTSWYAASPINIGLAGLDGLRTYWYQNGQKEFELTYKDGKLNGLATKWYKNGQKSDEGTWKDGKGVSATVWKPNGEQCPDTNVVDGNGIWCYYHENGQKAYEATWKDGEQISSKRWDYDGNPE